MLCQDNFIDIVKIKNEPQRGYHILSYRELYKESVYASSHSRTLGKQRRDHSLAIDYHKKEHFLFYDGSREAEQIVFGQTTRE